MDDVFYFMFAMDDVLYFLLAIGDVLYFMLAIGDISSPDSQTWPEQHSVPGGWRAWHKTQVGIINVSEMGGFNHHDPQ